MFRFISQLWCGIRNNHEYIQKNRSGRWHTECMNCLHKTAGITE